MTFNAIMIMDYINNNGILREENCIILLISIIVFLNIFIIIITTPVILLITVISLTIPTTTIITILSFLLNSNHHSFSSLSYIFNFDIPYTHYPIL